MHGSMDAADKFDRVESYLIWPVSNYGSRFWVPAWSREGKVKVKSSEFDLISCWCDAVQAFDNLMCNDAWVVVGSNKYVVCFVVVKELCCVPYATQAEKVCHTE